MATITLRLAKGSPLTNAEVDANFSNLNTELGLKEVAANKGVASGYASLDANGQVPLAQIPTTLTGLTVDSITNKVGADHLHYKVKATQALAKGDVVKVMGYNAGENAFEVAKVSAASDIAVGVMYSALENGALGAIINTGLLEGIDTSAFAVGTILYPNTSGGFTSTKPTTGFYQAIAFVVRQSSNNGTILIEASEPQPTSLSAYTNDAGFITSSASITGNAATATALQTGRTISLTGDVTGTSAAFNGTANLSFSATLANSGVTAGTYGSATNIPQIAVDAKGRLTSVTNVAVSIPSGSLTFTGDVTGSGSTGSSTTLTLANSGVSAGSYGGNNSIPSLTVDAKGRVTAASTVTPSGTWDISINGSAGSVAWGGITSKPTTVSGYGITDALVVPSISSNSILYFNSSGVATSSSALYFNGTQLGIGGWPNPDAKVDLRGEGAQTIFLTSLSGTNQNNRIASLYNYGGSYSSLRVDALNVTIGVGGAANINPAVTINSTGVGIGTTLPDYKLDIQASTASTQLKSTTGTNYVAHFLNNSGGFVYLGIEGSGGGSLFNGAAGYSAVFGTVNAYPVCIATNGWERVHINSSGNAGIGCRPSAWSGMKALNIGGSTFYPISFIASLDSDGKQTHFGHNAYFDGTNWKYSSDWSAARYQLAGEASGAAHAWFVSPLGIEGNNIAFTQAMTLTVSANLGVGTTNPLQRFTAINSSITGGAPRTSGSTADSNAVSRFQAGTAAMDFGVYSNGKMWIQTHLATDYATTYDLVLLPNGGNVGIGVATPGSKFAVAGTIESTTGGVKFPDGTTQTTAATGGLPTQNIVSGTSQTAVAGNHYVLTNAAATTVYLPASPAAGTIVWVTVGNGRTDNVIARNGQNINSVAEDMTIDSAYAGIQLRYADATRGWVFI